MTARSERRRRRTLVGGLIGLSLVVAGVGLAAVGANTIVNSTEGETVEVDIPFTVTWAGIGEGLNEYFDGREHVWKLAGSVRIDKGALSKTFDFSESGEFQGPDASRVEMDF